MIRLDKDKQEFVVSLKQDAGKALADMVLEVVYLYACTTEQSKAIVTQTSRMVKGDMPMENIDLADYSEVSDD